MNIILISIQKSMLLVPIRSTVTFQYKDHFMDCLKVVLLVGWS